MRQQRVAERRWTTVNGAHWQQVLNNFFVDGVGVLLPGTLVLVISSGLFIIRCIRTWLPSQWTATNVVVVELATVLVSFLSLLLGKSVVPVFVATVVRYMDVAAATGAPFATMRFRI